MTATVADLDVPLCLQGTQEFVRDGSIPMGAGVSGDAGQVSGWSVAREEGCERFEISLAAEGGAPATTPGSVEAEVLAELGIIRIHLDPSIVSTAVVDHTFESDLVQSAYTVRSVEGGVYIDIHLAGGAAARAHLERSPARVIVDLVPADESTASAAVGERIVVTAPVGRLAVYPLFVRGYARTFEGNVIARLHKEGRDPLETFATAADYLEMWGEFEMVFEEGPAGPVDLEVGNVNAESGIFEGVELFLVIS